MEGRAGLPLGLLICGLIVAGVGGFLLQLGAGRTGDIIWTQIGAAVLTALAALVVLRWLSGWVWGLASGLTLACHPLYWYWAGQDESPLLGEALGLGALIGVAWAWRLLFRGRSGWLSWGLIAAGLSFTLAAAWVLQPRVGLVSTALVATGLGAGCVMGWRLRQDKKPVPLVRTIVAGILAILLPVAGLELAVLSDALDVRRHPNVPEEAAAGDFVAASLSGTGYHGFAPADLDAWAWPMPWVVLPLMAYGWWRSFRRGWIDWAAGRNPAAWTLTCFALLTGLSLSVNSTNAQQTRFLPLATLAVLLVIFGVADVIQGISERLVLAPPQQET